MTPIISTWILIITLNGGSTSTPAHSIVINDLPDRQECIRVGTTIADRLYTKQSLCVEVKKVKL